MNSVKKMIKVIYGDANNVLFTFDGRKLLLDNSTKIVYDTDNTELGKLEEIEQQHATIKKDNNYYTVCNLYDKKYKLCIFTNKIFNLNNKYRGNIIIDKIDNIIIDKIDNDSDDEDNNLDKLELLNVFINGETLYFKKIYEDINNICVFNLDDKPIGILYKVLNKEYSTIKYNEEYYIVYKKYKDYIRCFHTNRIFNNGEYIGTLHIKNEVELFYSINGNIYTNGIINNNKKTMLYIRDICQYCNKIENKKILLDEKTFNVYDINNKYLGYLKDISNLEVKEILPNFGHPRGKYIEHILKNIDFITYKNKKYSIFIKYYIPYEINKNWFKSTEWASLNYSPNNEGNIEYEKCIISNQVFHNSKCVGVDISSNNNTNYIKCTCSQFKNILLTYEYWNNRNVKMYHIPMNKNARYSVGLCK